MITIGLPFYNAEDTLADAIRSVFAQTCEDWELILVNDGSTDKSIEVATAVEDPRVRVVDNRDNKRLAYRLNQIIDLANGEYIARMDADDMMSPERLSRELTLLESNRRLDLVSTGMVSIDNDTLPTGIRGCEHTHITGDAILNLRPIAHATVLARTEWCQRNPYDPSCLIAQDYDLWCRAFFSNRLHAEVLPEPLYFVREESSVTLNKILRSYRKQRELLRRYGPDCCGWLGTGTRMAKTYVKGGAYRCAAFMHRHSQLVRRRSAEIPEELEPAILQSIAEVRGTTVPGFP